MVDVNWELFLWFLWVLMFLRSIGMIVFGASEKEMRSKYDYSDVVMGIIYIVVLILCLIL